MSYGCGLTTQEILTVLSDEVAARSGKVLDVFDDGSRLFARSVLPRVEEVRPGDRLQGGVALRSMDSQVWVHPYVFREVCRNGAIVAQALETRHLAGIDELPCAGRPRPYAKPSKSVVPTKPSAQPSNMSVRRPKPRRTWCSLSCLTWRIFRAATRVR
jgi:hypothetical protein